MAAYPAFFALYPTIERIRRIRALEYSNGVRAMPLWYVQRDLNLGHLLISLCRLAYLSIDSVLVLFASAGITIIFAVATPNAWYHVAYLFPVFFLYGIASILLSYVISLIAISQLAAFASSAGGQAYVNPQHHAPD
jgi:ATP-binding cassette subfamily A (ABC1) protein 3